MATKKVANTKSNLHALKTAFNGRRNAPIPVAKRQLTPQMRSTLKELKTLSDETAGSGSQQRVSYQDALLFMSDWEAGKLDNTSFLRRLLEALYDSSMADEAGEYF